MQRAAYLYAIVATVLTGACAAETDERRQTPEQSESAMLQTPQSVANEHRELHETLAAAAKESGELGAAAQKLEEALAPHFRREEEIATPPLSLLPMLAQGPATSDMRKVLAMTDALERELPQMLAEHRTIRQAASEFRAVAESAGRQEYVRLADNLAAHARQEEEILYPAAVLVGRYVELAAPADAE